MHLVSAEEILAALRSVQARLLNFARPSIRTTTRKYHQADTFFEIPDFYVLRATQKPLLVIAATFTWPSCSSRAERCQPTDVHRCCSRDSQGPISDPLLGAVSDSYMAPAQSVCVLDMLRII
jgi:hypothetical protein